MAEGFYVDFGGLHSAAEGVIDTLNAMATRKVSDIDAPVPAFGHEGLGNAVVTFCDRWELGVENLSKDGNEIADRLVHAVLAYLNVDRSVAARFTGVVQSPTGPDPAAEG